MKDRTLLKETVRKRAYRQIQEALLAISRGKFIQISRRSQKCELSIVAHRYSGDMKRFEKIISHAFEDAVDALSEGQWLEIEITE